MAAKPMNSDDILLLGLRRTVAAISRLNGRILWETKLPGGMGNDFVTVLSDGQLVFAHTEGKLHCLALENGRILWSNSLSGYGYGIASLSFPGGAMAPDSAVLQGQVQSQRRSNSAS